MAVVDPVLLTRALIRKPSVTPADEGAMDLVQAELEALGFACRRMTFEGIENLYARRGTASPNLCFAGHTDVVPTGPTEAWSSDPFAAEVSEGVIVGRGAVDMKGGIAAWIAAVSQVLANGEPKGSLSFLITGDEEGRATHGTKLVVEQLLAEGERIDACVVGEPSSLQVLGDTIKIGRRGSLNVWITVTGKQGHVAYPERGANPIPVLLDLMKRLNDRRLDDGYEAFQPSNLEITTLDVGNPATNVIPGQATGRFNIRFNPAHTGASLMAWIEEEARVVEAASGQKVTVEFLHSGDAFLTQEGPFTRAVQDAVQAELGVRPEASTTGGTSDARFIRALCPVLELGLVGQTMHQIDERVSEADLHAITRVYARVIRGFFAQS
ncbi:succinyl-diaminopimelate desuccinylase [Brevundimonas sp.]|uniref:succinyl-diaminopimelate desuccinylase n=1 Tax=Brevundimonas sp. TaxID=1871086 RepID=UPI0025E73E24|nr:succinyl-diaminopimelate desuccinylase [Brevundimonas sp.]